MHQVPIVGRPVLRRVLTHRRNDHPIGQYQLAQPERREQRWRRRVAGDGATALSSRLLSEPAIDPGHEGGIAGLEVVVTDPETPRQQVESKLRGFEVHVSLGVLEPFQADLGGALKAFNLRTASGLVGSQCRRDIRRVSQCLGQRDAVFHGKLAARAHRKMDGVGSVAHQNDVLVMPTGVTDIGKPAPDGFVLEQPMPVQLLGKQRLTVRHGGVLVLLGQSGSPPGRFGRLDDEGGVPRLVLVRVHPPQTVRVFLEVERERGKGARGAQPHEPIGPKGHGGLKELGVLGSDEAVEPVCRQNEVRLADGGEVGNLRFEMEFDPEVPAAAGKDLEKGPPGHAGEGVSRRGYDLTAIMDVYVVPTGEVALHGPESLGIRRLQIAAGGVRKDHAESEGVLQPVPLVHHHLMAWIRLLHQDGEVQSRGATTDTHYSHEVSNSRVAARPGHSGAVRRRRPSAANGTPASPTPSRSHNLQVTCLCTWSKPSQ